LGKPKQKFLQKPDNGRRSPTSRTSQKPGGTRVGQPAGASAASYTLQDKVKEATRETSLQDTGPLEKTSQREEEPKKKSEPVGRK